MNRAPRHSARILGTGLAVAALVGTSALTPANAAPAPHPDLGRLSNYISMVQNRGGHVLTGHYFVQVAGAPTIDGGSVSTADSQQTQVTRAAGAQGLHLRVTHRYSHLFNGFSAQLSASDAQALQAVPGVEAVYPVVTVQAPKDQPVKATDAYSEAMGGVSVAKSELGYNGKGIKVGVIDSGADLQHPDLGGGGAGSKIVFPNKKIVAGYDFVGDTYNSDTNPTPNPDPIPQDNCMGHGTHVSGIIAGDGDASKGGVQGVAPKAQLGEYRVLGCNGSGSTDVILQGMERAYTDGMNVVNMSLGSSFASWPSYPDAVAANKLTRHGVTVVVAAGNDGESGAMSTGSPGVAGSVITVASMENTQSTAPAFQVTPDGSLIGWSQAEGAPTLGTKGSFSLVAAGAPGTPASLACDSVAPVPANTFVLISRGTCSFAQKALNAQKAGAAGVVIYNNQPGIQGITVVGATPITIPVVSVSQDSGAKLQQLLAGGSPITMTLTDKVKSEPNPTAGLLSTFSSWGLAANLALKPDITAPGGQIWSDLPLNMGVHGSMSGTSMATPYVAGSVALLMQARPDLIGHPQKVKTLLQNTSSMNNPFSLNPKLGLPELVTRQGAGLIQIDKAILADQSTDLGSMSLGEGQQGRRTYTVKVSNSARRAITYSVANIDSIGYLGNSDPAFDLLQARVSIPKTVTVPAHGHASFKVSIAEPKDAPNGYVYGGWIQLTAGGATTLTMPYAGMAGDYQKVPVLGDTTSLPSLGQYDATTKAAKPVADGVSYTMKGTDVPYLMFHLEYPSSDVVVNVYKVTGRTRIFVGTYADLGPLGRDKSVLTLPWDGTITRGKGKAQKTVTLGAGSYALELKVLEPMANPKKAGNWVVYTTPSFTIADPAAAKTASTSGAALAVNGLLNH